MSRHSCSLLLFSGAAWLWGWLNAQCGHTFICLQQLTTQPTFPYRGNPVFYAYVYQYFACIVAAVSVVSDPPDHSQLTA